MDNTTDGDNNMPHDIPSIPKRTRPLGGKADTVADLTHCLNQYDDHLCVTVCQYGGDAPVLSITDHDGAEIGWIEIG